MHAPARLPQSEPLFQSPLTYFWVEQENPLICYFSLYLISCIFTKRGRM